MRVEGEREEVIQSEKENRRKKWQEKKEDCVEKADRKNRGNDEKGKGTYKKDELMRLHNLESRDRCVTRGDGRVPGFGMPPRAAVFVARGSLEFRQGCRSPDREHRPTSPLRRCRGGMVVVIVEEDGR